MLRLFTLFTLAVALAAGAGAPKVAVLPLVVLGNPRPEAATEWLVNAASLPIEMAPMFSVKEALAATPRLSCGAQPECLAKVCAATGSGWAVSAFLALDPGGWLLSAQVVDAGGRIVSRVEALTGEWKPGTAELDQLRAAFVDAFTRLALADLAKPRLADAPLAGAALTLPPPATAPPELVARRGWTRPARLAAGALGLATAVAGGTLLGINAAESSNLAGAMRSGLVPPERVNQAAGIDERSLAATGLLTTAALAVGLAVVFTLVGDDS